MMNENMLIKSLDHYCEEETNHGPLGGMAWDEVGWEAHDLMTQYGWTHIDLEHEWPALFRH